MPSPPLPSLPEALLAAERLAVLGVGSELRGDDAAGILLARRLQRFCLRTRATRLAAFAGHSAPENLTGEIGRFKPTLLLVVDAAHLGREPGAVELIPRDRIGGASFSTHMLPLPVLLDYLEASTGCSSMVIGIQPAGTALLGAPSPEVTSAVRRLALALQRAFAAA